MTDHHEPTKANPPTESPGSSACQGGLTRRRMLATTTGVAGVAAAGLAYWDVWAERFHTAECFIGKAATYDVGQLTDLIKRGLREIGFAAKEVRGKSVMLKPNLVEPMRESPHVNTDPRFVRAVVEVFLGMGASEVFIAEGQGHVRDTYYVLEQSGLEEVLHEDRIPFVDLNHDDVFRTPNRSGWMRYLKEFHLPTSLKRADLIVSLPKMKTHHWAGVTLSMKNFFGVMPGVCYGWPKNVLHFNGIPNSINDIVATVRPHLAIIDGVVGMEGDGPIMGTPRQSGLVVISRNLPAADATGARLMGFQPEVLPFLRLATGRLGPIAERNIQQRGEPIAAVQQVFSLPDHPHFRQFRP